MSSGTSYKCRLISKCDEDVQNEVTPCSRDEQEGGMVLLLVAPSKADPGSWRQSLGLGLSGWTWVGSPTTLLNWRETLERDWTGLTESYQSD